MQDQNKSLFFCDETFLFELYSRLRSIPGSKRITVCLSRTFLIVLYRLSTIADSKWITVCLARTFLFGTWLSQIHNESAYVIHEPSLMELSLTTGSWNQNLLLTLSHFIVLHPLCIPLMISSAIPIFCPQYCVYFIVLHPPCTANDKLCHSYILSAVLYTSWTIVQLSNKLSKVELIKLWGMAATHHHTVPDGNDEVWPPHTIPLFLLVMMRSGRLTPSHCSGW